MNIHVGYLEENIYELVQNGAFVLAHIVWLSVVQYSTNMISNI